ncbi:MAG: EamA family transporter [Solirubrobacteraceae bacterium]
MLRGQRRLAAPLADLGLAAAATNCVIPAKDKLLAALVAVIWGSNFVVIEEGLKGFPPFLLVAARFTFVVFPLILFLPRPGSWRTILLVGMTMGLGQFTLIYLALDLGMPAGLASLVIQVQVMFTILISQVALAERASRWQMIGVVIGFGGLGMVIAGRGGNTPLLPLVLTLGGAMCWAVGSVITRHAHLVGGLALTAWSSITIPLPALGIALAINGPHAVAGAVVHASLLTIASIAYTVLASSLVGYGVWNSLLARHPVSSVVPFTLLVPVAGLSTAWIVLGQVPSGPEALGGMLLLAGVAIAILAPEVARQGVSDAGPYPSCAPLGPEPSDYPRSQSPTLPL